MSQIHASLGKTSREISKDGVPFIPALVALITNAASFAAFDQPDFSNAWIFGVICADSCAAGARGPRAARPRAPPGLSAEGLCRVARRKSPRAPPHRYCGLRSGPRQG